VSHWRNAAAVGVIVIGLTQMTGDILGNRALKGLGAATAMAPCPKVFCDMDGLEAFASSFEILAGGNESGAIPITPELYSRFKGPYNRRNVYGAAIAAAPLLPESIWRAVFSYGFRSNGPLRREFSLPEHTTRIDISIRTNTRGRNQGWIFPCTR
jgi:hypothetical protein